MTVPQDWMSEIRNTLKQIGLSWEDAGPENGSIALEGKEGYGLSITPDGVLTCSFKVDLEELRMLISGDTTEDLSDDELGRVARQELRSVVDRQRPKFRKAGFEEGVEADHDEYAITFKKNLTGTTPQVACDMIKWCREALISA
jgi:hypothetical protein